MVDGRASTARACLWKYRCVFTSIYVFLLLTKCMPDKFRGLGIFLDTYANARHGYAFPRIVSMLGDGKMSYDHADDGEKTKIGACSANFRRTNVATKVRITYIKEGYLKVQIQYKACEYFSCCNDGRALIIDI